MFHSVSLHSQAPLAARVLCSTERLVSQEMLYQKNPLPDISAWRSLHVGFYQSARIFICINCYRVPSFPKKFVVFASLCSFICVQAVYINFQDLCASLLGDTSLRILLLTFISHFVIDFLFIWKVFIFSAIATDDRHPLRSRSIYQNAANCMTIHFHYLLRNRGGWGKLTAHAHVMMCDHLPVGQAACRVRRQWSR